MILCDIANFIVNIMYNATVKLSYNKSISSWFVVATARYSDNTANWDEGNRYKYIHPTTVC